MAPIDLHRVSLLPNHYPKGATGVDQCSKIKGPFQNCVKFYNVSIITNVVRSFIFSRIKQFSVFRTTHSVTRCSDLGMTPL